jgi:nucleoside-diphosphate-sugar epimerase
MSTLVTGAFGGIGAWVVRGLLADGERPVAFDPGVGRVIHLAAWQVPLCRQDPPKGQKEGRLDTRELA